jgi:hypothetical protein
MDFGKPSLRAVRPPVGNAHNGFRLNACRFARSQNVKMGYVQVTDDPNLHTNAWQATSIEDS